MSDEPEQLELFGTGERTPPKMAARPPAIRFTRFRPRTRTLCTLCIRAIHRLGILAAPHPAPVRWHYHLGALTEAVCERHKIELEEHR